MVINTAISNGTSIQVRKEHKIAFLTNMLEDAVWISSGCRRTDESYHAESLREYNKLHFCCSCCFSSGSEALLVASEGLRMLKQRQGEEINLYQFVLYHPFVLCISCDFGI